MWRSSYLRRVLGWSCIAKRRFSVGRISAATASVAAINFSTMSRSARWIAFARIAAPAARMSGAGRLVLGWSAVKSFKSRRDDPVLLQTLES